MERKRRRKQGKEGGKERKKSWTERTVWVLFYKINSQTGEQRSMLSLFQLQFSTRFTKRGKRPIIKLLIAE